MAAILRHSLANCRLLGGDAHLFYASPLTTTEYRRTYQLPLAAVAFPAHHQLTAEQLQRVRLVLRRADGSRTEYSVRVPFEQRARELASCFKPAVREPLEKLQRFLPVLDAVARTYPHHRVLLFSFELEQRKASNVTAKVDLVSGDQFELFIDVAGQEYSLAYLTLRSKKRGREQDDQADDDEEQPRARPRTDDGDDAPFFTVHEEDFDAAVPMTCTTTTTPPPLPSADTVNGSVAGDVAPVGFAAGDADLVGSAAGDADLVGLAAGDADLVGSAADDANLGFAAGDANLFDLAADDANFGFAAGDAIPFDWAADDAIPFGFAADDANLGFAADDANLGFAADDANLVGFAAYSPDPFDLAADDAIPFDVDAFLAGLLPPTDFSPSRA